MPIPLGRPLWLRRIIKHCNAIGRSGGHFVKDLDMKTNTKKQDTKKPTGKPQPGNKPGQPAPHSKPKK